MRLSALAKKNAVSMLMLQVLIVGCGGESGSKASDPVIIPSPTATASSPSSQPTQDPPKKPNVILIIADDLRPEIGAYGRTHAQTPNLDRFAKSAALFENSFVSMAVCAPSRFALLTGLRPDNSGLTSNDKRMDDIKPDIKTMIDDFRSSGYATESIGKVYHHVKDDDNGWSYQFRRKEDFFDKSFDQTSDPSRLVDVTYAQQAKERLRNLSSSKTPFFLAVGFRRPHLPFLAPPEDWEKYANLTLPQALPPQTGAPYWALLTSENYMYDDLSKYSKDQYSPPDFPNDVNRNLTLGYLASVSFVDGLIGDILNYSTSLGLDNNTIVIIWGDNGYKLNDYGYWSKATNLSIDIRVPLMIRAPGYSTPGSRIQGIVEAVDLYPTLAEAADLKFRSDLDGQSLIPLLKSPKTDWKKAAFAQYPRSTSDGPLVGYTLRTKSYRYTAWMLRGKVHSTELYDLDKDPNELFNIADRIDNRPVIDELEKMRLQGSDAVRLELRKRIGVE